MTEFTNDNRPLDADGLDPDRLKVRAALHQMLTGFQESKVHVDTLFIEAADALMRILPGNPYRDPVTDTGGLERDLWLLLPLQRRVNQMVRSYENALRRHEEQRAKARNAD